MDQKAEDAAMKFIEATATLPEYERSQVWAEALHHGRLGCWYKFPPDLATWFRQLIEHIDRDGPRPDYWPSITPW